MIEGFKPRYYQREAVDAALFAWDVYDSILIQLGTGAGKTPTASWIIDSVHPQNSLYLADQEELCMQPLEAIQRFTGHFPALEKAKHHASLDAKIVVGSAQTLSKAKRRERFPRDHFKRIIVDEAHRGSDRDRTICDYFNEAKRCGMTATPFRENLADLSKWYDYVAYEKPMLNLIGEGFAPEIARFQCPVEIDLEHIKTIRSKGETDFDANELDSVIAPHFITIAEMIKEEAPERFGIAYLPLCASSAAFANVLRKMGISAMHVDAGTKNRDAIIEAFKRKRFQWLCNSDLMSVGVDVPTADAMINLCPTKSKARYQQRAGRVLRVLPGIIDHLTEKDQAAERRKLIAESAKPNALFFDLLCQDDKLGIQGLESIVCTNAEEASIFRKEARKTKGIVDVLEMQRRVQIQREKMLIKALERAASKQGSKKPIAADHVCALIGAHDIVGYLPLGRSEMVEPSTAQLERLKSWGIETSSIKSKDHASKLMGWMMHRFRHNFASIKQLKLIAKINDQREECEQIRNTNQLTRDEASAIIDTWFQEREAQDLAKETK